ncbi:adenylyl-sulfate kinase [Conexibacter arvalis]|nr:adenylyl-sulfate kinase [Conexibacter arvalis]
MTSANVTWHEGAVGRMERWQSLGARGATLWFTGLPASGKSTVAAAVEARLVRDGRAAYRLDGDNLRHGVCGDLGFSPADREENVRRTAEVARLLADAGTIAIVSVVSPFAAGRAAARALHERDGLQFVEIFVNTPVEECIRRDPKGLYKRARAGELQGMTGVDAPYEAPVDPDVELTFGCDVGEAVERVLSALDPAPAAVRGTQPAR